ncbi:hypothetical protein J6Y73_02165 [bacterium]|nr:hypothetical protein [bacterium]
MDLSYSKNKFNKRLIGYIIILFISMGIISFLEFYFIKILFENALLILLLISFLMIALFSLLIYLLLIDLLNKKDVVIKIGEDVIGFYNTKYDDLKEYNILDIKDILIKYHKGGIKSIKLIVKKRKINLRIYSDNDLDILANKLLLRMNS